MGLVLETQTLTKDRDGQNGFPLSLLQGFNDSSGDTVSYEVNGIFLLKCENKLIWEKGFFCDAFFQMDKIRNNTSM